MTDGGYQCEDFDLRHDGAETVPYSWRTPPIIVSENERLHVVVSVVSTMGGRLHRHGILSSDYNAAVR